ncbi:hypothetical protein RRG08_048312 [Elysia crispata]|uniref:Uncharacterized protein n=1 Tax=Elysia crispata TaxID=231223 RepID=A0AAE0ZTH5_9GAST|nr:hypothetical protein RRG08_048312 [Elysia crispata]
MLDSFTDTCNYVKESKSEANGRSDYEYALEKATQQNHTATEDIAAEEPTTAAQQITVAQEGIAAHESATSEELGVAENTGRSKKRTRIPELRASNVSKWRREAGESYCSRNKMSDPPGSLRTLKIVAIVD